MERIRCPQCGDIIPLRVTSCPNCRRCPSCGRKNRVAPKRCVCDYPDSEIAIDNLKRYRGLSDEMAEVEKRCYDLNRRYNRATALAVIGFGVIGAVVIAAMQLLLPIGPTQGILLAGAAGAVMGHLLKRRHRRLIQEARSQVPGNA